MATNTRTDPIKVSVALPKGADIHSRQLTVDEVSLGDTVFIFSRGQYRSAEVTRVGRKLIGTRYATVSGFKVAQGRQEVAQRIVARGFDEFDSGCADRALTSYESMMEMKRRMEARGAVVSETTDQKIAAGVDALVKECEDDRADRWADLVQRAESLETWLTYTSKSASKFWEGC